MLNDLITQLRQSLQKTKKSQEMVLADRKLKLREIADTLKISEGSVFTILHEDLSIRKLCSKCYLIVDQKQQRVDDPEHCLEMFKYNKNDFFMWYVTMYET